MDMPRGGWGWNGGSWPPEGPGEDAEQGETRRVSKHYVAREANFRSRHQQDRSKRKAARRARKENRRG